MYIYIGTKIMLISLLSKVSDIYTSLFLTIPLLYMVMTSVYHKYIWADQSIILYLGHYIEIFTSNIYLYAILNSLFISCCTTFICIILSYPTAYFISNLNKFDKIIRAMIIIPCWLPFLIRIYSWMYIIDYYEYSYSNLTIILGGISCFLPFSILAVQHLIDRIDKDIIEAAYDLGASTNIVLFKIIIPYTSNGLINIVGFVFIPMLGEYFITSLLGGSSSIVIGRIMYTAVINDKFELAAAYMVSVLLIMSPYLYFYKKRI